jgi:hypothetical protein
LGKTYLTYIKNRHDREILAQIRANAFCAGLVLCDDVVIETAPILRRMRGWSRAHVHDYCRAKGWTIEVIHIS